MANLDLLLSLGPVIAFAVLLAWITQTRKPNPQRRWIRRFSSASAQNRLRTKFEIEVRILEDGIVILTVVGELDCIVSRGVVSPSTPSLRFRRTVQELGAQDHRWIALDCTGLRVIDVHGYNEVLSCWDRMQRARGEMVLVRGDEIRRLWSPGIIERPPLSFQTVEEAVQYLRERMRAM